MVKYEIISYYSVNGEDVMNFVKMHGLGNDFVITEVDCWSGADILQPHANWICDRHFGVGADGLVAVGRNGEMDIFMRIFNPDGSEPEMCGNAIRCVARYAFEQNWTPTPAIAVRTLAGPRFPVVNLQDGQVLSVTVDMGEPILRRELIPMQGRGEALNVGIETLAGQFQVTAVSMGNPHAVIFVDDIEAVPVAVWGPAIENHPLFPAKTNVEFIQRMSPRDLIMRVWERGAGVTLACGTGACATLVAAVLNGRSERSATVHLLGGDLFIEWKAENNHVYMTGPATLVYSGSVSLPPLTTMKEVN